MNFWASIDFVSKQGIETIINKGKISFSAVEAASALVLRSYRCFGEREGTWF